MKLGEICRFQDIRYFKGWVFFDEESVLKLEDEVKRIRDALDAVKNK